MRDIDWTERSSNAAQAYSESKLFVTALALTLARVWPEVLSNAVDPGWVPTKTGGPYATGDLQMGYLTGCPRKTGSAVLRFARITMIR